MCPWEAWGDPDTNERAEIKDGEERTWRHPNTCQFETTSTARVPRLLRQKRTHRDGQGAMGGAARCGERPVWPGSRRPRPMA
jgi:hypothetical protein